ncbi:MAG: leukotoxin LktA family filamentous adhesin, partial [Fusobacteriaceae bacterium]|nr:leukotoxin LktA family filamentous adhesin [Fusobacteriaceae bacterium]
MDKTVLKQTEKCLKRWIKEKHIGFTTALLVGFLISGEIVVGASEIQRTGDETKLSPTDSRFEIYAEKVNGENAFNRFGKFSLGENEIANLYFKEGADKPEASNLFNFVREKISVDGTVNAVRDGKIGGNLYFLSPEGMIIGTKGVVNTGSFYMITPEGDKFDAAMANAQNGTLSSGIVPDSAGNVNIPLNPEGTITVRGKIFATDDISLHAAKITIGDSSDTFETATSGTNKGKRTNKTAVLKTGVTNFGSVDGFGNVVNIADIASSGLETGALTATRTPGKGNITLAARAVKAKSTQIVDDIVNDGNFGNVDELIRHEIKAEVDSYGTLDAAGNVNISAIATNGDYLKTELGRELYDTEYSIADVKASVNIHDGSIDGEDVDISARAVNFYDTPDSVKWGSFAVTNLLGSTTPFNFGGALALLSAESDVNVKQSVWITARENLKLESKSDAYAILGASTALFKGNNYYLKGANAIPSLALAYVKMDVDADLTIEGTLTAAKALTAEAKASNEMKAAATESTIANDAQFGVAVLISQNTNHAKVDVTDTAKLESAGAMTIESTATNSITSEAEAKLGDSGVATVTVNYSEYESSADINIAGKLETKGTAADLTVSAVNRTTDNEILTTSTDGLSKFNQKIRGSGSGVGQILDTLKSKMNAEKSESKTEFLNMLKAGAAVTVVDHKNTADVTIKGSADLKSTGNLEVSAQNTVEDVHMETASDVFTTQKDDPDKVAVSAGVAVVDIENTANVTVENDAKFNADKDITLESAVNMEYRRVERMAKELTDSFNAIGDSAELLPENLKSEFEGIKSMFESFWNQVSGTTDALVSGEIFEIDIPGESGGKKSGSAMELLGYITGEASGFFEKIGVQIDALTEEKSPTYDDTTPTFYMLTALKDTLSRATSFASPGSYANFNTRSST